MVYGIAAGVVPAVVSGLEPGSLPGVAAFVAGVALLARATLLGLRGRRRRVQLLAIPILVAVLQWGVLPPVGAGLVTSGPHPHIPPARSLGIPGARDVTLASADGVPLAGWYVPGTNGAAVILLHGSHGTRVDTLHHLLMLRAGGYAVLAYDARGHGNSGGQTNALGWQAAADLAGALSYVRRQAGIRPGRVAALGLSMGAEEALRAAASGVGLNAVIADGAGASTSGDQELAAEHGLLAPVARSVDWLTMRETELAAGEREPAPLRDVLGGVHIPVLLIASGAPGERTIDTAYRRQIGPRARLWYVPDAAHTMAFERHPDVYRARVFGFLLAAIG
jgi:uncharacterized protein